MEGIVYFAGMLGLCLLAILTMFMGNNELVYAAYDFISYFDWFLIIPGGLGSVITGVWLAVRTNWGLRTQKNFPVKIPFKIQPIFIIGACYLLSISYFKHEEKDKLNITNQ